MEAQIGKEIRRAIARVRRERQVGWARVSRSKGGVQAVEDDMELAEEA
jgi:alkylated DNA nucleotide flippase Atl1